MVEIKNIKDFERWLDGKPAIFAVTLAMRIALRLLPLYSLKRRRNGLTLNVWRTSFITWVVRNYPFQDMMADALTNARASLVDALADARAIRAAANADVNTNMLIDALTAARAVRAAANADPLAAARAVRADATYSAIEWDTTYLNDISFLDPVDAVRSLMTKPLWPEALPSIFEEVWAERKSEFKSWGHDWAIWIDWYEQRLKGSNIAFADLPVPYDNVALTIAMENEVFWQRTPGEINTEIKSRLDAARQQPTQPIENEDTTYIPPISEAAIIPVVSSEHITLGNSSVNSDLSSEDFIASLKMLKRTLGSVAEAIRKDSNLDRRVAEGMDNIAGLVGNEVPVQTDLFEIAHALETFKDYDATVKDTWPEFMASQYRSLLKTYERVVRQVPSWRAMVANAQAETYTASESAAVKVVAREAAEELQSANGIDPIIGHELDQLSRSNEVIPADPFTEGLKVGNSELQAGSDVLTADLLESLDNILKTMARLSQPPVKVAKDMMDGFFGEAGKGLVEAAKNLGGKVGPAFEKLVSRAVKIVVYGGLPASGTVSLGQYLVTQFPDKFHWLEPILKAMGML